MKTWKFSGTAVQGRRHAKNNTPCQDKIFSLSKNGINAIALADGAGSSELSHYGAEVAVKTICEKLCNEFDAMINNPDAAAVKRDILDAINLQLNLLAEDLDCKPRDLASTLLAAASDDKSLFLVHLGDGIIGCSKRGEMAAVSYPDNGEYKNETVFTTSRDALVRMKLLKGNVSGISGVALMSDGTEDSFFNRKENRFLDILEEIKQKSVMYTEEDTNRELHNLFNDTVKQATRDDCSLIVMSRPDEFFRGYRDLEEMDQYDFLSVKTAKRKAKYEKIFSILAGQGSLSRAKIIEASRALGLKRRQVIGLLRELDRKGFIKRTRILSKRYRLNFYF